MDDSGTSNSGTDGMIDERGKQTPGSLFDIFSPEAISSLVGTVSLKTILAYVITTPILSSFVIAIYSFKFNLPFFAVLSELGANIIFVNFYTLFYMLFFTFLIIFPSLVRHYDKNREFDQFLFKDTMYSHGIGSAKAARNIFRLLPFALPGFVLISAIHLWALWISQADKKFGKFMTTAFWLYLIFFIVISVLSLASTHSLFKRFRARRVSGGESQLLSNVLSGVSQTIATFSIFILLPMYFISFTALSTSDIGEYESLTIFCLSPALAALLYLSMIGPVRLTLMQMFYLTMSVILVLAFAWPGLGTIVGGTLKIFNEGGGSPVTIYVKEGSREKFVLDQLRSVAGDDLYKHPLKELNVALRGSSLLFLYDGTIVECRRENRERNQGDARCPRTFTIAVEDIQAVRNE